MSLLDELVADARLRARELPADEPVASSNQHQRQSLRDALAGKSKLSVIAEFKKASPSLGAIATRPLESQVQTYVDAGASAISVLTEPKRFRGSLDDLERAARAVDAPILMKDFVVDVAQIRTAARLGARAVLLIVRCLSRDELDELVAAAHHYGLSPLVECHDVSEVSRALDQKDAVIGVNNRDLDSLVIDRGLAVRVLQEMPRDRVVVAESGYETAEQTRELRGVADAVLMGSALMKLDDPTALIREVTT